MQTFKFKKALQIISISTLAIVAIVLGMKSLKEADIFWMIRTGAWMFENKEIISRDVFSYTFEGSEWINVKWLFELIVYGFYSIGGTAFVPFLQSIINLALIGVFLKFIKKWHGLDFHLPAFILCAFFFLLANDYRMTGRPEMISHLFSAGYLMLLLLFLQTKNYRFLFALSGIMAFWVNLHEAYGTGLVMYFIVLGSHAFHEMIIAKKHWKIVLNKKLLLATGLLLLGVCINPRTIYMLYHPIEIFGQVGDNKFSMELYDITSSYYKSQKEPYLALFTLIVVAIYSLVAFRKKTLNQITLPYFVLLLAFVYLATTAHRNIAFLMIIVFPAFYLAMSFFLKKLKLKSQYQYLVLIVFGIGLYASVSSGKYYELTGSRDLIGLQEYPASNPSGLSHFMVEQNIEGKIFSDYLISSYLLLYNYPQFKSYIDFRDLDVFPKEYFQDFIKITAIPAFFEREDGKRKFEYVALFRNQFQNLHQYLYQSDSWKIVFADPVSILYAHKERVLDSKKMETFSGENFQFQKPIKVENRKLTQFVNKAFLPFFKLPEVSINLPLEASRFLQNAGDINGAFTQANLALNGEFEKYEAHLQLGYLYSSLMLSAATNEEKNKLFQIASSRYQEAQNMNPSRWEANYYFGNLMFNAGGYSEALSYFSKVLKVDKKNKEALVASANCMNGLMQQKPEEAAIYTKKWFEFMETAHQFHPDDNLIKYRLGISYCQRNNCEKAKPFIKGMFRLPELTDTQYQELKACQKRCGI